ncbi:ABC transporter substrate-binding protein [Streptomyces sp. VRA16 Mangrove soil]|uniref:ABC transporter substrate-binding protein n=1 Tax=Streptomyces sp. VRA16 Mangrove soil TaxID=2817434 RepID=UPI001A9FE4B1|nr:sugar ABC transporter substrate-binding protein [Streptomyces sp. VRA16 Mangrove soil]MBO1333477.1 sugar ABC transporter substrate-binding protein [Streptomyces sp. VRA16 Mangrove soil]
MRRRTFLAAALAGLSATAVAGCGGPDSDAAGGRITLEFLSLAWQKESVDANKALVAQWNDTHDDVKVTYVQGSWDNIHDQLLTSFEGGEAPDIFHDDASDLTDFANGGYLADLTPYLPRSLRTDIPKASWETTTYDGKIYGVPFLQEPRVLIANSKLLDESGVRVPTAQHPWTWDEFEEICKKLTHGGNRYGVAWSMKEPVSQSVNLSLSTDGKIFYKDADGRNEIRYDAADSAIARLINRQVDQDRTAPKSGLGMSGSDTLPGFFAGRYAMLPLNFSYRQQVQQQAPKGFAWEVLPLPSGAGGLAQGTAPQTLSVSEDSRHKKEATEFIAFLTQARHQVRLARGDWLLPTSTEALKDPSLTTAKYGWRTGADIAASLRPSPVLGVRGYAEWKDKIATPAYQEYYNGGIGIDELRKRLATDGNRILDRYQR